MASHGQLRVADCTLDGEVIHLSPCTNLVGRRQDRYILIDVCLWFREELTTYLVLLVDRWGHTWPLHAPRGRHDGEAGAGEVGLARIVRGGLNELNLFALSFRLPFCFT